MAELKFPVFQQVWATRRRQDNTACLSSIVVPLVIAWVTHELTWNYEITRYVTGHEVYHKLFFHSIPLTSLRDSTDKYLKIGHLLFHRNSIKIRNSFVLSEYVKNTLDTLRLDSTINFPFFSNARYEYLQQSDPKINLWSFNVSKMDHLSIVSMTYTNLSTLLINL